MEARRDGEGPVVLQLHKWDPSRVQFDVSEYREGFLSPTRELLLLHSFQNEALLLPLSRGDSYCITSECRKYESVENVNFMSSSTYRSESLPGTSESVGVVSNSGFSPERNILQSNTCPIIADVNSLAWGLCGDTYKQHTKALFQEFLFVVGDKGVTVHAFRRLDETDALVPPSLGSEKEIGRWVEWGPDNKADRDVAVVTRTKEAEVSPYCAGVDSMNPSLNDLASKRWLLSFLSSVKTLESKGVISTHFPGKSEIPRLATVVSFSVSFNDSCMRGFFSGAHAVSDEGASEGKTVSGSFDNEAIAAGLSSNGGTVAGGINYHCFRVFSSNFYHFIGFVLSSECDRNSVPSCENQVLVVIVARLVLHGLQWLYSVKLPQSVKCSEAEWVDFQMSDKFLISLNEFGSVFLHDAITGEYIAVLDILQLHGVTPKLENVSADVNCVRQDVPPDKLDVACSLSPQTNVTGKKRFRKLLVAPYSSLFTVVDECGVAYVVCASDLVPDKYDLIDKLLPQYLRLGFLAPWVVGASDIGQLKVRATPSTTEKPEISSLRSEESYLRHDFGCFKPQSVQNWHVQGMLSHGDLSLNGFSSGFQESAQRVLGGRRSPLVRKLYLPIERLGQADLICFSPLGMTRLIRSNSNRRERSGVVHTSLYIQKDGCDDTFLDLVRKTFDLQSEAKTVDGKAVGCIFQGFLYLVTSNAISVVLPSVSVSSNFHPIDLIGYQAIKSSQGTTRNVQSSLTLEITKQLVLPWQVAVLGRVILYEGADEADRLCLQNNWELKFSRLCRLQLAVAYLKFEEMEQALEMLAEVKIAEEGILRLIFAVIYMMVHKVGSDADVSAALRLLALATRFATKMLRRYAVLKLKNDCAPERMDILPLLPSLPCKQEDSYRDSRRLHEMAYYLEIIRNIQGQLDAKYKRLGEETTEAWQAPDLESQQSSSLPEADEIMTGNSDQQGSCAHEINVGVNDADHLALVPIDSMGSGDVLNSGKHDEMSFLAPGVISRRKLASLEKPKEMFARWEVNNLDSKNVVKDALLSGRLPLAVLQLHLQHLNNLDDDKKCNDTFAEVREIGRTIAYELLVKGETALAVTTLQKLGEDVETCLKQLLFGTVSRSLRRQIAEEVKRYGFLKSYELAILDRISLIERIYPCSSFWKTYTFKKMEVMGELPLPEEPPDHSLQLLHSSASRNVKIECGDINGVVLGSWSKADGIDSSSEVEDDISLGGYWAGAAVWSKAWDHITFDRILLDQPFLLGVHVMWESQFEYHVCHNDWEEVSELLQMVPSSLLFDSSLLICVDDMLPASSIRYGIESPAFGTYIFSPDQLDSVCIVIPNIRIFRSELNIMCSSWLRMLIGRELAKRFIFLKEHWSGAGEIIFLLAQSGFLGAETLISPRVESVHHSAIIDSANVGVLDATALQAFHNLVVRYCAQYNLPHLLDLYLEHHKLALDNDSISSLLEAAGDCQWAKWLLFSRVKGHEYDASFSNARALLVRDVADGSIPVLEDNDLISTVDDIAEAGWVMAALATLMFAPLPVQSCISSGSVKRSYNSFQCTLENLRPVLQKFPSLWRVLLTACLGQDTIQSSWEFKGRNALSIYVNWRDSIFCSSGHDTSLLHMLPSWFPKILRRLIQLFVQGPLGWPSMTGVSGEDAYMQRDIELLMSHREYSEISSISWEAAIQKQIEQELYPSSVEDTGIALEQHLHRGRGLAAFTQLLSNRVQKLKSEGADRGQSNASMRGQANFQSDVQTLLDPLTQDEELLLSPVIPLAITHYQDSMLVGSCAFMLELCGVSAGVLRVDVAVLRRIHNFYRSNQIEQQNHVFPNGSTLQNAAFEATVADSLAQALADYYHHQAVRSVSKQEGAEKLVTGDPSPSLMLILQHLEKASLLVNANERTCGSWLLSGEGDGNYLRSQQKAASQHWSLVTVFCQNHQLPLSIVYLTALARDNDWVGFLSEAQIGGYTSDSVVQVAAKEFKDPRLRTHILSVLRCMESRKKTTLSSSSDSSESRSELFPSSQNTGSSAELFEILAQCERHQQPGKTLLLKAKELRWSLLAMVASCFPDVAPSLCLTVWLEITAAREISSIKENKIASQIANNVAAAVEASNALTAGDRVQLFHYNRKCPKRRRLGDHVADDLCPVSSSNISSTCVKLLFEEVKEIGAGNFVKLSHDSDDWPVSLPKLVALLCQQHQFLPLLRAFEMFLPSCCLLPFIRALQAFSQMRLSEASAHLGSFSLRIKEEPFLLFSNFSKERQSGTSWISSTAVMAADAILSTCPSPYEKRCLLQFLASTDFGDGGSAAVNYRRQYWKINFAEPSLRKHEDLRLGDESLDDASLLTALENSGYWEQARNWARQLEAGGGPWKAAVNHVTERQAESMVAEWKEFLWDVAEERVALWRHCQSLFIRYSFPALQAGLFFLKHAEAVEKELPPRELHELLLLSLQWLSGMITKIPPACPLHLLREIETRVWLLAVESEAQLENEKASRSLTRSSQHQMFGNSTNIVDQTAGIIAKMDSHISMMKTRGDVKESNNLNHRNPQTWDAGLPGSSKNKRRNKAYGTTRRLTAEVSERSVDVDESSVPALHLRYDSEDDHLRLDASFSSWEERVGHVEIERAVLSLLEFGQISAAKQLQNKLSSGQMPYELRIVDAALKVAESSTPLQKQSLFMLDEDLRSLMVSHNMPADGDLLDSHQVLESLSAALTEGSGRGLCKRIIAVVKASNVLGISFLEAFKKQPTELLQLLCLKAQDSFDEATLLVKTYPMPATSIANILAESFLKGLLAAHRGGYIDSQKEEGPAPLLWRFSDFLKWAELCPSEQEIGHALMRLVITGQEIPHACEVELLILSHHFYQSSACLDGVDVLVALAATRVEAYVSEGDFSCLARLITGVGNFHALNFILGILVENGQLDLLLQKYSAAADANAGVAKAVRGFRMAVVTALKHFNPNDHDSFAMVYNHFDMKHETALLLESRAEQSFEQWHLRHDKDQNEDLLESMRFYIEAAEVYSSIDAGNKTRSACAHASLVSLQIRMPDIKWLNLSETSARRLLVEQSRFQEALIVAEAYNLNQPSEWTPVLWNQMLKPEVAEQFVAEFVAVLPLHHTMLIELAKFYRSEMVARGDQSHFSVWLTGGGLPAEWAKYLGRSFRCLLKRTRDLTWRLQMATLATGFNDVIDACNKALDKVPENAGPLVLRKGHGGAYLPLM